MIRRTFKSVGGIETAQRPDRPRIFLNLRGRHHKVYMCLQIWRSEDDMYTFTRLHEGKP
jgi:hypothetical protein